VKKPFVWALMLAVCLALTHVPVAGQAPLPQQPPKPAVAPLPQKVAVVVLDPAHGGSDTGARGPSGAIESEVVLDFARAVRVALEAQGFRALLTREGNQDPSFDDRSALINGLSDAVFISLHVSSTGTAGTARAYFCSILPRLPDAPAAGTAAPPPRAPAAPAAAQAAARRISGLLEWGRAQEPYLDASRRLAELVQIQLAQKFQGSPETPSAAPIRQLRTIAAPAIAVEVSSVAGDPAKLTQMGQPLGEALARAATDFQEALTRGMIPSEPVR
jgi:N-acetylmuramoyl-L-alanine amidase